MALEIERKFLVEGDFKPFAKDALRIIQGYMSSVPGRTVRIRLMGDKGFITIKGPVSGISRFEWEKEIEVDDARQLLDMCLPGIIEKTRWLIPATPTQLTWEVDEFHGRLAGLTIAELELQSEQQTFDKPSFVGQEVTGDPRYYNANI